MQWVPGPLSSRIKRTRLEADHSPLSSAEVKKEWTIPPHPISLHGVVFIKHQGQLYLVSYSLSLTHTHPHTQKVYKEFQSFIYKPDV
jgi:hypothetical protein